MLAIQILLLSFVALASTQGVGKSTRYWDCCKPSTSWPGKANLRKPLLACDKNDKPITNQNAVSGCNGGEAYMCSKYAPVVVNNNLSYGTVATALGGKTEADTSCSCYELTFTDGPVKGKKMIVQSINTGGDLGTAHFDIAIPGGGLGIFDGCTRQFGYPESAFGQRYGGVSSANQCGNLPPKMRAGCDWRFGWFKGADNPALTYKPVQCPAALTARTGCIRADAKSSTTTKKPVPTKKPTATKKPVSKPTATKKPTKKPASKKLAKKFAQCGGKGYLGPVKCVAGSTCKKASPYYSQCL